MKLKNVAVAVVALALAAGMTACGGSASSTAASSTSEAVSSSVAASSEAAKSLCTGFPVQRLFPVQWFLSDSSKARIWARSAAKWIPACRWAEESPLQIISFSKAFRLS